MLRFCTPGQLLLQCLPGRSRQEIKAALKEYKSKHAKSFVFGGSSGMYPFAKDIPRRLWSALVNEVTATTAAATAHSAHAEQQQEKQQQQQRRWSDLRKEEEGQLCQMLSAGIVLSFEGKDTNKEEFVTAGGVHLREVNLKTCESKQLTGLYFGGEVLNVDGVTGGFNFQSCWTTGFIVGESVGDQVEKRKNVV